MRMGDLLDAARCMLRAMCITLLITRFVLRETYASRVAHLALRNNVRVAYAEG